MTDLALTYWSQGRFQEADELRIKAMEMSRNTPKDEDLAVLINTVYIQMSRASFGVYSA
jgi:hypothetical protein